MSWFVVVQYLPDNLKNRCCLSEVSAATDVVVRGGSWWFNTIMPPSVKFN